MALCKARTLGIYRCGDITMLVQKMNGVDIRVILSWQVTKVCFLEEIINSQTKSCLTRKFQHVTFYWIFFGMLPGPSLSEELKQGENLNSYIRKELFWSMLGQDIDEKLSRQYFQTQTNQTHWVYVTHASCFCLSAFFGDFCEIKTCQVLS